MSSSQGRSSSARREFIAPEVPATTADPSRRRLHPLVTAVGLALATLASPLHAAPAVAHWTLVDLGTLGGSESKGSGLNNAGQVTGYATTSGGAAHAFLYSSGSMTDLGTLGGNNSVGSGINDSGQVTGYVNTSDGATRAFRYSNGSMTDLGTLGGESRGSGINSSGQITGFNNNRAFLYDNDAMTVLRTLGGSYSEGHGINAAGQITGFAQTSGGDLHAFLFGNGVMTDLGTLGGSYSIGYGINNAGQITGRSDTSGGDTHAFLYSNGRMTDLGTLGGSFSIGNGINNAGQLTGYAITSRGEQHAFLYSLGAMADLNSFNGVAGSGWTLANGSGINDVGQITGHGTNASGQTRAFLLTLDTTVWEGAPGAAWDTGDNWSHGIAPNRNTDAFIEPLGSRTILGPGGTVAVKTLTIGRQPGDGSGIATLQLNGGHIELTTTASRGLTNTFNGVLTGRGTIAAGASAYEFHNYGRIVADDVILDGMSVHNYGTIEGDGRLAAGSGVYNYNTIRVAHAGDRLRLDGPVYNTGRIDALHGEIEIAQGLANSGQINLRDGVLRSASLANAGRLDISSGGSDVFGAVVNQAGGRVVVSGQGQATFWDGFENFGELRVSGGSIATFFGHFYARNGGVLTGTGSKYFESGYSVGNSPGVVSDEGDVGFGADARVEMELGGLTAGVGDGFHDKLNVKGLLILDGTLKLTSWKGFTGQVGQSFDLFDWGRLNGSFDTIDSTGLRLADGTRLDVSRLYLDGSIAVLAVPEPESYTLMLAGLGLVGFAARRRPASRRERAKAAAKPR